MNERISLPPLSNQLSDAPSAVGLLDDPQAGFVGGLVTPRDLSTVFQPIVELEGGEVLAYEALVRCSAHQLTPSTLFERAAADHSAGRLGRMVREIAIPLCAGTPLFVNLHPSELE
jgi:EAL domain-containing protein (putative c-di-GMP-specific phosphodiesterase class I)